jgi:hypothetical protein
MGWQLRDCLFGAVDVCFIRTPGTVSGVDVQQGTCCSHRRSRRSPLWQSVEESLSYQHVMLIGLVRHGIIRRTTPTKRGQLARKLRCQSDNVISILTSSFEAKEGGHDAIKAQLDSSRPKSITSPAVPIFCILLLPLSLWSFFAVLQIYSLPTYIGSIYLKLPSPRLFPQA